MHDVKEHESSYRSNILAYNTFPLISLHGKKLVNF